MRDAKRQIANLALHLRLVSLLWRRLVAASAAAAATSTATTAATAGLAGQAATGAIVAPTGHVIV